MRSLNPRRLKPTLMHVILDSNHFSDIPKPLFDLENLTTISLNRNRVAQITLSTHGSLQKLFLDYNCIRELPDMTSCPLLDLISARKNPISRVNTALAKLQNLTELDIDWFLYT